MIDKKDNGLNLLPIDIQTFAITGSLSTLADGGDTNYTHITYQTNVSGTYSQGGFPAGKYVSVTLSCVGTCIDPGSAGSYIFNGISLSSTTIIPPNTNYYFNSSILDDGDSGFPYSATATLSDQQWAMINLLVPGTYYVFVNNNNIGAITITTNSGIFSGSTSISKNFVISNKTSVNPIIAELDWDNPTSSNLYHYYSLSNVPNPSFGETVYGWYGPQKLNAGGSGTIGAYVQLAYAGKDLPDGHTLYLSSYVTGINGWTGSQFDSITAAAIYENKTVTVRDIYFNFTNPSASSEHRPWGTYVQMPTVGGYNWITWVNTTLGSTQYYYNGTSYNTMYSPLNTTINAITNNTYWFNMDGARSNKTNYTIQLKSKLLNDTGNNWINYNTYYTINSALQNVSVSYPTGGLTSIFSSHITEASRYSEYSYDGMTVDRSNDGGSSPYIQYNNLFIPAGSYGNINLNASWTYLKNSNPGVLNAINSGLKTDINGATKNFYGYNYNFYKSSAPSTGILSVPLTSNISAGYETGTFVANTKAGYEFDSNEDSDRVTIITFPFTSDGSISTSPWYKTLTLNSTNYSVSLPSSLYGNSGSVKFDYNIHPYIGGTINIGVPTRLFEHPIYVNLGTDVLSFDFNGQTYNSSWSDKYYYGGKIYLKLAGATFNVAPGGVSYNLNDMSATPGYSSPNYQIWIDGVTTNAGIESAAFINLPTALATGYSINAVAGIGVSAVSLDTTSYFPTTPTFTPVLTSITKKYGYNTGYTISGTITNIYGTVASGLSEIATIPIGSINEYSYLFSTTKEKSYINKHPDTPYGISSYTFNKSTYNYTTSKWETTYEISTSKQGISVSYIMNDGYSVNQSNIVSVSPFINSTGSQFTGADQTYNKFNIPPDTIGNVIFTPSIPSKTPYTITPVDFSTINGIDSMVMTPSTYYISNSGIKQGIGAAIGLKPGYLPSSASLSTIGSLTSELTNSSFKINTNGFGHISVIPWTPLLDTYNIYINPVVIPGQSTSGISSVSVTPATYNAESPTFTPTVGTISYINSGFSGYTSTLSEIPVGSYGDKSYEIYANPVEFNINIIKDISIVSYAYQDFHYSSATIDTYNIYSPEQELYLHDIRIKNSLYEYMENFYIANIPTGSIGDKSYTLSSPLKVNSITINALPTGYISSIPSSATYIATNTQPKTITLTHTMNPGYLQPTDNLIVSQVFNDILYTEDKVDTIGITNKSFTIPLSSWGDITVEVGTPTTINYQVSFPTSVPTGVNAVGYGVLPTNYKVTDSFDPYKEFTLNLRALPGYQNPTWTLNGIGRTIADLTFTMPSFSTTPPVITTTGGSVISYNMNIIKGTGINTFNYISTAGDTSYSTSSTVATYNILSTKTITLTNIKPINNLWKAVSNYTAISVAPGNTGDKTNTVSSTLKISSIGSGILPTGISTMTFSSDSYQAVTTTDIRNVDVTYVMNEGYNLPSTMTVTGSLDGTGWPVAITPLGIDQFSIAPNTYGSLIVTPSSPAKITYNIIDGTLPYGMSRMNYNISSAAVTNYQIATSDRIVDIVYTMNNGYTQPTEILTVSGGTAVAMNYRAFSIPAYAIGNVTITPNTISKITYNINTGSLPTGITAMTVTPNNYTIDNTVPLDVSIDYTIATGYANPGNPVIIGSNTSISTFNTFSVLTNGYGNITVTPPSPIVKVYNVIIETNPKPAAINQWSVSPINYKVIDTYPKTFNITATNKAGYAMPTWSINGTMNSGASFAMDSFTETLPNIQITEGNPISYSISLDHTKTNSGITDSAITPLTYNIETPTFTPSALVTYAPGYSGYVVSPTFNTINVGSIGDRPYTIMGTPIPYTITKILGAGINANLSKNSYNIQQTPFTVAWSDIVTDPGYIGYTLSGDSLSVPINTIGNRTYTIEGNIVTYDVLILNPEDSGIVSFDYPSGTTWTGSEELIDTFNVTSDNKSITLENIVYSGEQLTDTIEFGVIPTGSTGNRQYALGLIYNVYIDVDSWNDMHYKIQSFDYKGITNIVNTKSTIWIDYFVEGSPTLTIDINNIIYEDGYTGPTEYSFGTIIPSLVSEDRTYVMDQTTLIPYKVYIQKDDSISSFKYNTGFVTDGEQLTVSDNTIVEVDFNVQSQLDVTVYDIIYTTGYEGNNNGATSNPITINYDTTNFDRSEDIGSIGTPLLVTYDKLTIYTITMNKNDPSTKLISFVPDIKYTVGLAPVINNIYTVLSDSINATAISLVYKTEVNDSGEVWPTFGGPSLYGYDDGVTTSWSIPTGSTGNKVFTIPVDDITAANVFTITYNNTIKTANGYTSQLTPLKLSYTYGVETVITHNDINSFIVTDNVVLPAISDRLRANDPIHFSYSMSSDSDYVAINTDTVITISNTDFGDKVIDIDWEEVIFTVTVKDHYIIKDVYGIKVDVTKPSPISGLNTDANIFVINYSLNSTNQDKLITNNIYNKTDITRNGWTYDSTKEINDIGTIDIVGTYDNITRYTIPAGWYDDRVTRLVYTPNIYTISLVGADNISIIYDHEVSKWNPGNVPTAVDKIFGGYKDISDIERITYGGIYNFNNNTYLDNMGFTDIEFTPKWIDRNDFISYDATSNVVIDSTQMEDVIVDTIDYSRFKESFVSPILVQNILVDEAINTNLTSSNTKYIFDLLSGYIKFRKIVNKDIVKGYNTLTLVSNSLNTYLNTPATLENNMVISMSDLITQLEAGWSGAVAADLLSIGIKQPYDLWTHDISNRLASADVLRIMFKVSNSISGPFTYWIFDGLIKPADIAATKQATIAKQDMFLMSTSEGLKEIMKIKDKDNVVLYDRTPHVLDNNGIITNWESVIIGQSKPVDTYGLLPVNKDKVYSMDIGMKTSWKSETLNWTGFTTTTIPHNANIRLGEQVDDVDITNYSKIPIKDIYASKLTTMGTATLNNFKTYSVVNDKLVVDGIDSILGTGANEKGAISSDGDFYIPTLYYTLSINNTKSSSLRTAMLSPAAQKYVYTPTDRNIGSYIIQGPVSDVDNSLRFLLNTSVDVVNVHIGKLDTNLNTITELITLTREDTTEWYKLTSPFTSLTSASDYYTIVIETADKLMYNNLLLYKRFAS